LHSPPSRNGRRQRRRWPPPPPTPTPNPPPQPVKAAEKNPAPRQRKEKTPFPLCHQGRLKARTDRPKRGLQVDENAEAAIACHCVLHFLGLGDGIVSRAGRAWQRISLNGSSPCEEEHESYLKVPAGFDPPRKTDAGSPLTRKKCTPLLSALDTERTLQASNRQPQPPAGLKSEPKQPEGGREPV
jgi:hypothetical protein